MPCFPAYQGIRNRRRVHDRVKKRSPDSGLLFFTLLFMGRGHSSSDGNLCYALAIRVVRAFFCPGVGSFILPLRRSAAMQ